MTRAKPDTQQLQMLADAAEHRAAQADWCSPGAALKAAAEPPPPPPPRAGEAFGMWLLRQQDHRKEWIARLAKSARSDPRFPKAADPEAVRVYLGKQSADGDAHEALDDAEMEWLCL